MRLKTIESDIAVIKKPIASHKKEKQIFGLLLLTGLNNQLCAFLDSLAVNK